MKRLMIVAVIPLLFIGCQKSIVVKKGNVSKINVKVVEKKQDKLKIDDIENLTAKTDVPQVIKLNWKLQNKKNVEKIEILKNSLDGSRYKKVAEISPKLNRASIKQKENSYVMYKVRLILKSGKKSRGKMIKVIPLMPNYRKFKLEHYSQNKPVEKTYEVITEDGIDYIEMGALKDMLSEFFGDLNYKAEKDFIKISKKDGNFKLEFDINENKATLFDKNGLTIKNFYNKRDEITVAEGISSGEVLKQYKKDVKAEFKVVRASEKIFEKESLNLNDFDAGYIKKNSKIYFPIYMISYFLFNGNLQITNYDGEYFIKSWAENYKINKLSREKMDKEMKRKVFLYFINLCKKRYTVSKDKNIDFDKMRNDNMSKLINTKSNAEFYDIFNTILTNMDDGHTRFINFGKSNFVINGTNRTENSAKAYEEIMNFYKTKPDKKFDEFILKEIDNKTAYIYIPNWIDPPIKIDKELNKLNGKKYVILDMRWNGGGLLSNVFHIINYFAGDKYELYNMGKPIDIKNNSKKRYKVKLILLTNRLSFSASNYMVNIVKNNNLGIVIGEKTGGGGSPSEIYSLPDSSLVGLSSGTLITDKAGNSNDNGIEPDIKIIDKYNNGKDSIFDRAMKYIDGQESR
ncbi:S41 family peptidase [Haliovirga abyssi]|uniref:Tail specific protease domain-containing protein n=1 Tax=Haliovirga abyssi TaxID=2996794 RepID=A0AAU9D6H8_9FUSO|nr:S41 family peptidase [Haliovirga abyssi]BDU51626.1 hypothetical protein HLVA_21950 [Haliovirga abyssi]